MAEGAATRVQAILAHERICIYIRKDEGDDALESGQPTKFPTTSFLRSSPAPSPTAHSIP
jgi:hypothetical protein